MSAETRPRPLFPVRIRTSDRGRKRRRRRPAADSTALVPYNDAPRVQPRRHRGRWIVGLILLGIAALGATPIVLWSRYATAYVTSRNATVKGSITQVGAPLNGIVAQVAVEAGQRVTAGQVLARFDDHQLQANVLRATSRLAESRARHASADARISAAESQRQEARFKRDQRIELARTGAIAQDELRSWETRLQTAEALERTAIADGEAAAAEVSTAEAELALARADREATVIRAPGDGRVVRRISEPGASVVVGQPVVALWIGAEVWVEAWIDENDLSKITVGSPVKVTVNSFPGRAFHGTVQSIGASTDFEMPESAVPQSRTERLHTSPVVPVRVRLEDREGLLPGLSAVVAIQRKGAR